MAVLESQPQIVSARFSYGLLDLVSLIDETVSYSTLLVVACLSTQFCF